MLPIHSALLSSYSAYHNAGPALHFVTPDKALPFRVVSILTFLCYALVELSEWLALGIVFTPPNPRLWEECPCPGIVSTWILLDLNTSLISRLSHIDLLVLGLWASFCQDRNRRW